MYSFVPKQEYKKAAKLARSLVDKIQSELKKEKIARLNKLLIGSVKSRLVTRKSDKDPFDFDYHFEITKLLQEKDLNWLMDNILKISKKISKQLGFSDSIDNDSKVIRFKYHHNNQHWFNVEIAIVINHNSKWKLITFDKDYNKLILNERAEFINDSNLHKKFLAIRKHPKVWEEFKNVYLTNKNELPEDKKSISIYFETINEISQKFKLK